MITRSNFVDYFEKYANLRNFGVFKAQREAVERIDNVLSTRTHWHDLPGRVEGAAPASVIPSLKGLSRSLTQSLKTPWSSTASQSLTEHSLTTAVECKGVGPSVRKQGAYIFGPVGQGKTVLLDLIGKYLTEGEEAPLASQNVLRCHYHQFMLAIHKMLHELRKNSSNPRSFRQHLQASNVTSDAVGNGNGGESSDLILRLIKNIVEDEKVKLILLDECQITSISDAMICKRFFTAAFKRGLNLICTSNCPIDELYAGGLNRDAFIDFIPVLRQYLEEIHLDSNRDLRTLGDSSLTTSTVAKPDLSKSDFPPTSRLSVITPGRSPQAILSELVEHKVFRLEHKSQSLPLFHGRTIKVDLYSPENRCLVLSFTQACCQNRSPSDFIAIAQAAPNGIWLHSVPVLDLLQEPERVRRFISFLDVVYDQHIPLVLDMSAPPLCIVRGPTSLFQSIVAIARSLRQHHTTISAAWDAVFKTGCYRDWMEGCLFLGLWGEDAALLWNTLNKHGDRMTIDGLRQAICFCIVHGVADASVWTGECFQEKPASASQLWVPSLLQFLGGVTFSECIQMSTKFSGVLNPSGPSNDKGTIDVAFAVPRLISRLCEIQTHYRSHHPLLSTS